MKSENGVMTVTDFESRVKAWASARPDLQAFVQIGSRVQQSAVVDDWSDWDYQLILSNPSAYQNHHWPSEIAPCWSVHFERTERGVVKLSAVFEGGFEVDFVLLAAWQMKLVCWAMRHPGAEAWFPRVLTRGVRNLQLVARPGYRVIHGGPAWEARYAAMTTPWPERGFTAEDFEFHVSGFWRHAVWVAKKLLRGEGRAALRWFHVELREHTLALLAEEARLEDRAPRPEARQAERWLSEARRQQTAATFGPERALLAAALRAEIDLFDSVSGAVARQRGFVLPDRTAIKAWLAGELAKADR
jgi:hypothetical protein